MIAKRKKFLSQKSKALLLTFEFLFFCSFVYAQQFKVGLLGGIATSQVDGDTYAGYDKLGFLAGGFVEKRFSMESKWSASFEITYVQKGSRKIPHPDKGDNSSYKLNLNYAEVPLLLKYNFGFADSSGQQKTKFTLEGGASVGSLVSSKEEDLFGPVSGGTPFQKTDISILFGLRYFLTKHLGFNIRSEYSLAPVRKGGTSSYYQNWTYRFFKPGYYNNLLLFSLHYHF